VGATTENPSFEVVGALLSRVRVFVLEPLSEDDLSALVTRALEDEERGLGARHLVLDDDARALLVREADGDARRALTVLEAAAEALPDAGRITRAIAQDALQRRFARYDKGGEEHFNHISAYHKALRGSDPDGALYWLARMIDGGEDPLYVARRTIRFAVEDVGLADPQALAVALAAREAYAILGSPEGDLALAEAAVYLACAPKSTSVYRAWGSALEAARATPAEPVPLHIRNAPTDLMKDLGYGKDYRYDPDEAGGFAAAQGYLPDKVGPRRFYEPRDVGGESEIRARLARWTAARAAARGAAGKGPA